MKDTKTCKSSSTLIRNVRIYKEGIPGFLIFYVEMDGEGRYEFSSELRYGLSEDDVKYWVDHYSHESITKTDGDKEVQIKGEKINRYVFFSGRTPSTKLKFKKYFLKNLLENKDFDDKNCDLYRLRQFSDDPLHPDIPT